MAIDLTLGYPEKGTLVTFDPHAFGRVITERKRGVFAVEPRGENEMCGPYVRLRPVYRNGEEAYTVGWMDVILDAHPDVIDPALVYWSRRLPVGATVSCRRSGAGVVVAAEYPQSYGGVHRLNGEDYYVKIRWDDGIGLAGSRMVSRFEGERPDCVVTDCGRRDG